MLVKLFFLLDMHPLQLFYQRYNRLDLADLVQNLTDRQACCVGLKLLFGSSNCGVIPVVAHELAEGLGGEDGLFLMIFLKFLLAFIYCLTTELGGTWLLLFFSR